MWATLGSIEKKTRDKAVRSLRKFIATGADLSKADLLKLWKGLFYCKDKETEASDNEKLIVDTC